MNKDNLHFAAYGLMLGFIAGYLLHDVMVARQPLRRPAGEGAVVTSAAAPDGGGATDDSGAAGGAPAGSDAGGASAASAPGVAGTPGSPGTPGNAAPAMAEVQQLRDYVATHPKDADAVLKLANLNFDISNWGRARDLYTQYIGLREANPDVLTDLGTCYRNMRQFDSALEQFRRAEKLAPEHWKSRFAEVVVLGFDLNQQAAADQAFARLQAIAPAQAEVAQLGAALQRRRASGTAAGGSGGAGGGQ